MSGYSTIEWTDATWNPVTGCTKVSAGCLHCYAERLAERFRGIKGHPYEQGFDLRLWPERLAQPLRWKSPRRIFVNSMSDLFHHAIPREFLLQVFQVMEATDWHIYQVLTKRSRRLARLAAVPPRPRHHRLRSFVSPARRRPAPRLPREIRAFPQAVSSWRTKAIRNQLGALFITPQ